MMDENFLLYRKRSIELLELMKKAGKSWELYVFSSANAIRKYTMKELVELGVSWIWMRLESPQAKYAKLAGGDARDLTSELRTHAIKVLGSTIIGLEHHTPENIYGEIDHAVGHNTDFHQFMLYTPVPGTPLHREIANQGRLVDVDLADIHGQYKFNFLHSAISREDSKRFLDWAFARDFECNGPSLYRVCRSTLRWLEAISQPPRWAHSRAFREGNREAENRIQLSFQRWSVTCQSNETISKQVCALRRELAVEFGAASKLAAGLLGPIPLWSSRREERRLTDGVVYEPKMVVDRRNWRTAAS